MVEEGSRAPQFDLPSDAATNVSLSQLRGKPVVVYFYPKDDTSGCTVEAKDFSSLAAEFAEAGVTVMGISPDSAASHAKFRKKYELDPRLHLGADVDKVVVAAYGVWVEKSMYGRKYMGVERSTFLIDARGDVAKAWRKVKVPGHAEAVLAAARALRA
jgi:thioredoxin-dependent peroxiredoxin